MLRMSEKLLVLSVVVLLVLILVGPVWATTYYVDPNGLDTNPGTSSQPFQTIQKGANVAVAGDTVIVRDGIYTDTDASDTVVSVHNSGTASQPIVFQAEHVGGAVCDGQDNTTGYGWWLDSVSYVQIIGFTVTGTWHHGICPDGSSNHILIQQNHIHHIGNFYYTPNNVGLTGIYDTEGTSYNTYDANVIDHIGRTGGGPINLDHGIYTCGDFHTITNNTIADCNMGWDIQIAGYYRTVDGLLVSNNTFANGVNRGQIVVWGDVDNTIIQNNIFYNIVAGRTAIEFSGATKNTNDVIRYNLSYGGNGLGPANSGWTYSNNITGDPLFVDAGNSDFHLTSNSPARDAGTATSAPNHDQEMATRPINGVYDIGAFEYSGGGGNPPVANFIGNPTSGTAPLTVYFTDTSTNNPTAWSWTFGDGGASAAQHPSHQYAAGTYTVSLTATNAYGSDGETKNNYISATTGGSAPVANFVGVPTSGPAPLNVQFTDQSSNSPTSWAWIFGDGGTSEAQHPSHQYTAGTFTVTLTATNQYGSDGETKTNYITATSGGGGDYSCSGVTIVQGTLVSGDHTSTHASDNSYYTVHSIKAARNKYWIEEDYNFNTGLGSLSSLSYSWEAHNETNPYSIDYTIKAYNYATSTWTTVGTWTITGPTDVTYSNTIANPGPYISGGVVQLKIVADKGQVWNLAVDFLKITAQP